MKLNKKMKMSIDKTIEKKYKNAKFNSFKKELKNYIILCEKVTFSDNSIICEINVIHKTDYNKNDLFSSILSTIEYYKFTDRNIANNKYKEIVSKYNEK